MQITPTNNSAQGTDPDAQLASELDSATRELEKTGLLAAPSALPDDDSLEPELPPTPTQLGRDKATGTSQSLLSSLSTGTSLRKGLSGPSALGADITTTDSLDEEELNEPDIRRRKKVKRELVAQLDQLKADIAQLEKWSDWAKRGPDKPQPDQDTVASLM